MHYSELFRSFFLSRARWLLLQSGCKVGTIFPSKTGGFSCLLCCFWLLLCARVEEAKEQKWMNKKASLSLKFFNLNFLMFRIVLDAGERRVGKFGVMENFAFLPLK